MIDLLCLVFVFMILITALVVLHACRITSNSMAKCINELSQFIELNYAIMATCKTSKEKQEEKEENK